MRILESCLIPLILILAAVCPAESCLGVEEAPVFVGPVTVEGNRSMSDRQIRLLLPHLEEGRAYRPESLKADLERVEQAYGDSGFLNVKVEAPKVEILDVRGRRTAAIRITVTEGPRYTTGKIGVQNAEALDSASLIRLSPLQKGQPYSRIKAAQWEAKVEDVYRSLGYLKARCPARETVNERVQTVDCLLDCAEGKPYSIGKITLTGDPSVNPLDFKRRLLFSEGGLYNPEMLLLSFQFLNQSRLYESLSPSDVDILVDDEKATVDIVLRVVKLAR